MSDEKALLAAISAHPHDDTPRLVYADWLDENDRPARAEFIRVQCELARLDEWDEDRRPALLTREGKLWKRHEKDWRKSLPADMRKDPFRRGFVAPMQRGNNVRKFIDKPASAFDWAPAWDYVLEGAADGLPELARCAHLRRLAGLKLWVSATEDGAAAMLGSPHLGTIRSLELGYGNHWVLALSALAENPATESLTALNIHEGLDDKSAAFIASAPGFAKLRGLHAFHHDVTADGIRVLFASKSLAGLTELTLPGWYKEEGARAIAESRPAFQLRKLVMYGAWMTDAGVALVANWPGLASVRSLEIGGYCEVLGPRALAGSPYAVNLRELDLSNSHLSRAGALALARSKTLNLKRLIVRMTPAAEDEAAAAALVKRFGKDAVKLRYPGQRKRN
jgi:uncharacterized protein (TIGR02996 family)